MILLDLIKKEKKYKTNGYDLRIYQLVYVNNDKQWIKKKKEKKSFYIFAKCPGKILKAQFKN